MSSFRETIDRIIRTFGAPNPEYLFGFRVVIEPVLPIVPSDAENARRIVRHGMRDVLKWLREDVGPAPYEETHCFFGVNPTTNERLIFLSRKLYHEIRIGVDTRGTLRPYDDRGKDALQTVWTVWNRARRAGIL
jgi:hypothetical protein